MLSQVDRRCRWVGGGSSGKVVRYFMTLSHSCSSRIKLPTLRRQVQNVQASEADTRWYGGISGVLVINAIYRSTIPMNIWK